MPPAVAVVAAVAGGVLATGIGGIVGTIVGGIVAGAINYFGGQLFAPTPEKKYVAGPRQMFRSGTAPRQVVYGRARVTGPIVFAATADAPSPDVNELLYLVIPLAGHEIDQIETIYFNDVAITEANLNESFSTDGALTGINSGRYKDSALLAWHYGTDSQTSDTMLTNAFTGWTSAHRLRGVAYLAVQLFWARDRWPNGIPNITAVIRGKKVYDPRTMTTGWSNNWALCILDYLRSSDGLDLDDDEYDEDTFISAANIADEDVDETNASPSVTQKRYTLDGAFTLDSEPLSVLEQMLTCGAGLLPYQQGKFRLYAGAYRTPTITLTEDHLRGSVRFRPKPGRDQLFNRVAGQYIDASRRYVENDFPPVENATYEAQDGEQITRELTLPFVTDPIRAQRIAKIMLERSRQGITVELQCNFAAIDVVVGEPIMLTIDDMGWSSKPFMPLEWTLSEDGINIVLQEEASSSYDWNGGDATVLDSEPDTELPNPFADDPPTNLNLQSGTGALFVQQDGTVISRILVTWTESDDTFVDQYEIQWRQSAGSPNPWTSVRVGVVDEYAIAPVEDGVAYDVRVRAITVLGAATDWVEEDNHTVIGKTEPPSAPDTFTIETLPNGTRRFAWTHASPEPDVRAGGGYRLRYFLGSTSDWAEMQNLHTGLLSASPYETDQLAAGTYTFAIKTVDSTGNESATAVFISSTALEDPPFQNLLLVRREHSLGWPGTIADGFIDGEVIYAVSDGDWSDLPDTWAELPDTWSRILPGVSPVEYTSPVIDLGSELTVTPLVSVAANGNPTITVRSAPDGSPTTWTAYAAPGQITARFIQVKVSVADTYPRVDGVTIAVDSQAQVDRFPDVNTATESSSWFESIAAGHFRIGSKSGLLGSITQAQITAIQNTGGGYTWELISKSQMVDGEPAAEFKVYDETDTLADAVIDVELRGPKV